MPSKGHVPQQCCDEVHTQSGFLKQDGLEFSAHVWSECLYGLCTQLTQNPVPLAWAGVHPVFCFCFIACKMCSSVFFSWVPWFAQRRIHHLPSVLMFVKAGGSHPAHVLNPPMFYPHLGPSHNMEDLLFIQHNCNQHNGLWCPPRCGGWCPWLIAEIAAQHTGRLLSLPILVSLLWADFTALVKMWRDGKVLISLMCLV